MNQKLKRLMAFCGVAFTLLLLSPIEGNAQNTHQTATNKMIRKNFDFNWQLYRGDIAMKHLIHASEIRLKVFQKT
jgi:hypothetical protein